MYKVFPREKNISFEYPHIYSHFCIFNFSQMVHISPAYQNVINHIFIIQEKNHNIYQHIIGSIESIRMIKQLTSLTILHYLNMYKSLYDKSYAKKYLNSFKYVNKTALLNINLLQSFVPMVHTLLNHISDYMLKKSVTKNYYLNLFNKKIRLFFPISIQKSQRQR